MSTTEKIPALRPARRTPTTIPLYPYIKKWLLKKHFAGQAPPYRPTEYDLIGKMLITVIIDDRKVAPINQTKTPTDTIQVILTQDMLRLSATTKKLSRLNFYLDKLFKDTLMTWIEVGSEFGVKPYNSTMAFLAFYDIEEREYSHDAAYKYYQRNKQLEKSDRSCPNQK